MQNNSRTRISTKTPLDALLYLNVLNAQAYNHKIVNISQI